MSKTHKLYCFVDETGQDTKGLLYIVVAVISVESREQLFDILEAAEAESGKGKRKWHHNSTLKRDMYINKTLYANVPLRAYYQIFEGPELSYEMTTVLATSNAIRTYLRREEITDYKATVIIDGLPRGTQGRVSKMLRSSGIKTKSVRGERDESNPGIRLADAIAGLVRQSHQGNAHFRAEKRDLESLHILEQLP